MKIKEVVTYNSGIKFPAWYYGYCKYEIDTDNIIFYIFPLNWIVKIYDMIMYLKNDYIYGILRLKRTKKRVKEDLVYSILDKINWIYNMETFKYDKEAIFKQINGLREEVNKLKEII